MTCVHTFIAFIHAMHSYLNAMHSFLHAFIHTCIHAFITFILSMHMHSYMSCVRTFHAFILTCIHAYMHAMHWYMSISWVHTCHVWTASVERIPLLMLRRTVTTARLVDFQTACGTWSVLDFILSLIEWLFVRVTRVLHPLILEMHMHPPNSREMSTSKWLWIFFYKTLSWARARVYLETVGVQAPLCRCATVLRQYADACDYR